MLRFLLAVSAILTAVSVTAPAKADWLKASSAHFVIYADDREADLRRFSDRLERYHGAIAFLTQRNTEAPSPSNRVTVYVVKNAAMVRRLHGGANRFVAGFYSPRAGNSIAIIPPVELNSPKPTFSMIVLLHEYAHHFAISASSRAAPRWLTEGQAEFLASARFEPDGSVRLGLPAEHRAGDLAYARDVKVSELLDPAQYKNSAGKSFDAFYGKSWLLYHYLTFEPVRKGQLLRYQVLLNEGKGQREAALEAFGDFGKLEKDIDQYLMRSMLTTFKVPPALVQVAPVEVQRLSAGEAAMMPVIVQSRSGVTAEQAKELVAEAREIAGRYPRDPGVLAALAEAEHDADNDQAAVAAADAALAADPGQVNAHVQKGLALFDLAGEAADKSAGYLNARRAFSALNRREPDHPLPLIYYFRSFVEQGVTPPPLAIEGLERAAQLAPFDFGLRMTLGVQLIKIGRQSEARAALAPVAFNPHGGGLAEAARKVMTRLDSEPGWKGQGIEALVGTPEEASETSQ